MFGSLGHILWVPECVDSSPTLPSGPLEFMDSKAPYCICRGIIYSKKRKHGIIEICSGGDVIIQEVKGVATFDVRVTISCDCLPFEDE